MNAFVLRSKPHMIDREDQFLGGRLSIGWPVGKSLEGRSREELSGILGSVHDVSEISISMVELFVTMPRGSLVLSPSLKTKSSVHLFRTTSEYMYDLSTDNDDDGNPHHIEAEYLHTVPRSDLPTPVIKSLSGARKTISKISQHAGLLEDFIESGFESTSGTHGSLDFQHDALNVLKDLLNSKNEDVRLRAAIAITQMG